MTRIVIILAALFIGNGCVYPQIGENRMLTLHEIFSLADTKSKTIKISKAAVETADKDVSMARTLICRMWTFLLLPHSMAMRGWQTGTSPTDIRFLLPTLGTVFPSRRHRLFLPEEPYITISRLLRYRRE